MGKFDASSSDASNHPSNRSSKDHSNDQLLHGSTHSPNCTSSRNVAGIAARFTALWRAGEFRQAGEKYWAEHIVSIEPSIGGANSDAVCRGLEAVRAKYLKRSATCGIEDLKVDGPFVTGNQFVWFADMFLAHGGRRVPHSEIAVFTVRDDKIIEERRFYE